MFAIEILSLLIVLATGAVWLIVHLQLETARLRRELEESIDRLRAMTAAGARLQAMLGGERIEAGLSSPVPPRPFISPEPLPRAVVVRRALRW